MSRASYLLIALLLLACNLSALEPTATPPLIPETATPISTVANAGPQPAVVIPTLGGNMETDIPLVFLLTPGKGSLGDIFTWDLSGRTFKQLTTWGYNFAPHYSPDGGQLVYLSASQTAVTAIQTGAAANAQFYATIWLLNPVTGDATRIADQPQGATVASGNLIRRNTEPVWSPDGASVAWTEADSHGERLMIYTVASHATSAFPLHLPPECCEGAGRTLYWGSPGIAMLSNEGSPTQLTQVVYTFSPSGQQLGRKELDSDFAIQYGWVTKDKHDYLAGNINGLLELVDPLSNDKPLIVNGYPELFSPNAPDGLAAHLNGGFPDWSITRVDQALTILEDVRRLPDISIAPDGLSLVYVRGSNLPQSKIFAYSLTRETVAVIPPMRVLSVTWGPSSWRIHP